MQVTSDYNYTIIARLVQFVDYIAELFEELATLLSSSSSSSFSPSSSRKNCQSRQAQLRLLFAGKINTPARRHLDPIKMINYDNGINSGFHSFVTSHFYRLPRSLSFSLSLILTEATLVVGDSRIKLTGFLPSFLISAAET